MAIRRPTKDFAGRHFMSGLRGFFSRGALLPHDYSCRMRGFCKLAIKATFRPIMCRSGRRTDELRVTPRQPTDECLSSNDHSLHLGQRHLVDWCPWPGSNQHSLRNSILSRARLPIPPQGHEPGFMEEAARRQCGDGGSRPSSGGMCVQHGRKRKNLAPAIMRRPNPLGIRLYPPLGAAVLDFAMCGGQRTSRNL